MNLQTAKNIALYAEDATPAQLRRALETVTTHCNIPSLALLIRAEQSRREMAENAQRDLFLKTCK